MKKPASPRFSARHAGLFTLALLAGCATPPHPDNRADMQMHQPQGKGYLSEEQHSLRTTPVSWQARGRNFDLIVSSPVRPGHYPLVIYLPGLGEPRTAGEAWRNAWAQAGYVVVAVQLLAEDGQAWQSPAARNGDFKPLIRERFAAETMTIRLQALRDLLEALQQHAADPMLINADLGRIVLAGYDLGAYTAMAAAGERFRSGTTAQPALPSLAGIITLSPYTDFSGPGFDARYGALTLPVLSVTGPGDGDNYGIASAAARSTPFQHMPPGGKYLLSLDDVSHEQLSGSPFHLNNEGRDENRDQRNGGRSRDGGSERGNRGDRAERGGGPEGGAGRGIGPQGSMDNRSTGSQGGGQTQLIVAAVTTAFLDAQIRQDDIAQEWLRRDARRWLREAGSLSVR